MPTPRDRARQRRRLDAHPVEPRDPDADIERWLHAHAPRDVASVESLSTTAYLRATGHVALLPDERLRLLAVAVEPALLDTHDDLVRAWLAIDRMYEAAVSLGGHDASVHRSRAVTARRFAERIDPDASSTRIRRAAYRACELARAVAPASPDPEHTLARLRYGDPDVPRAAALESFDRALELDPQHAWSLLYRAHCLHDLERWSEAAVAYDAVPLAFFVGARAWRYEHLLEQRAWCVLRAGELERAAAELDALLTRWERNPHLAREAWGLHVIEAVDGAMGPRFRDRAVALAQREAISRGRATHWPGLQRLLPIAELETG
jgi:tetratricopeptide (TPR) repeat protein